MEVFEVINNILSEKKITKREFAQKLIALAPRSNRTGEVISENIIYSYLSGQTAIKAYLVPYISDVLGVPEQFLFEETPKVRKRLLKYLAKDLCEEEYLYLTKHLRNNPKETRQDKIITLLQYAPEPLLEKIEASLEEIKRITQKI